jgi:hypothetical protein
MFHHTEWLPPISVVASAVSTDAIASTFSIFDHCILNMAICFRLTSATGVI